MTRAVLPFVLAGKRERVEPNPATLRQDQRYLSRSMRRLTGLIAGCAVVTAIVMVGINVLVDVCYVVLDPRITYT